MEFFARDIEECPELSYLALIGALEEDLAGELSQRFKRINSASPETEYVALDIRGVNRVNVKPSEVLSEVKSSADELGWELYLCNIPRKFQQRFSKQDVVEICDSREELVEKIQEANSEPEDQPGEVDPLPVGIRTSEGVRLFNGEVVSKDGNQLVVETSDRNASVLDKPTEKNFEMYFQTSKLQIPPRGTEPREYEKVPGNSALYRIKFEIPDLPDQDDEQLESYFNES